LRVTIELPPLRRDRRPHLAVGLRFEARRPLDLGPLEVGAHHAPGGQHAHAGQRGERDPEPCETSPEAHARQPPAGFGGVTGVTAWPSWSDTVGCFTTSSSPCSPAWTSMAVPKSRPSTTSWKCSLLAASTVTTRVPCALKMTAVVGTRQRVPDGPILNVT